MKPMFLYTITMMLLILSTLILQRKHILMSLLALEGAMLTLVLSMMVLSSTQYNTHLLTLILTFGASEASIGLALLVVLTRSYGSDMMNLMSLSKC